MQELRTLLMIMSTVAKKSQYSDVRFPERRLYGLGDTVFMSISDQHFVQFLLLSQ